MRGFNDLGLASRDWLRQLRRLLNKMVAEPRVFPLWLWLISPPYSLNLEQNIGGFVKVFHLLSVLNTTI